MRLIQYLDDGGKPRAARVDGDALWPAAHDRSTYELALLAIAEGKPLAQVVECGLGSQPLSYREVAANGRLLPPLTHPQPHRMLVSITGLTHLGGAEARDRMHKALSDLSPSDSMKMFRFGINGGKPEPGSIGAQPEWCFKGDGSIVVVPGGDVPMPAFGSDLGEEPEVVALHVVGQDGVVYRLGFALGNEFTDHRMEQLNYLYLGHAKLRPCSIGPELLVGELPSTLQGRSRIWRDDQILWERHFLTGEAHMCHSIANLEHHHFKYAWHRRPGDVHAHFLGTATISFADNIALQPGDRTEVELPGFGRPLVNRIVQAEVSSPVIQPL